MTVLLIGSGGREHALAWGLAQSKKLSKLFIAPGNAATVQLGANVPIPAENLPELAQFARREKIDLTIVGPEAPIVAGIRDLFEKENLKIVAPSQKAALLEGSKVWAKTFLQRHSIPTARHASFTALHQAVAFARTLKTPLVIKADGLAAGKGVSIAHTHTEAEQTLHDFLIEGKFGESSKRVVIEDFLAGHEFSLFVASDGCSWKLLGTAQDYKRLLDGDKGPNTGGMGSISPVPWLTDKMLEETMSKIVEPTFVGLARENLSYEGILYFGLIWTDDGPFVIEYNVRFGDPEAQVLVPRFDLDLLELYLAIAERKLDSFTVRLKPQMAVCVALASAGYPEQYEKGFPIEGLGRAEPNMLVFHAGTARKDGQVVTAGGRVLNVVGVGATLSEARARAYKAAERISFPAMQYRTDIAG